MLRTHEKNIPLAVRKCVFPPMVGVSEGLWGHPILILGEAGNYLSIDKEIPGIGTRLEAKSSQH